MVFGIGSIVGPLIAGVAMTEIGAQGLFLTTIGAHVLMIVFTAWRIFVNAPVREADKTAFQSIAPGRVATPETAALAGGAGESDDLAEAMADAEADRLDQQEPDRSAVQAAATDPGGDPEDIPPQER